MKRIEKEVHQIYPFKPTLHKRVPSRSPVMKKKQLAGVSSSPAYESARMDQYQPSNIDLDFNNQVEQ
jgi:hypothetical protein